MAKRARSDPKRPIEASANQDKDRVTNPPGVLVKPATDPDAWQKKGTYSYDPHLDPQLLWGGKGERTSFKVSTVSLHPHQLIHPKRLIDAMQKLPSFQPSPRGSKGEGIQPLLFEQKRVEPFLKVIQFRKRTAGVTPSPRSPTRTHWPSKLRRRRSQDE